MITDKLSNASLYYGCHPEFKKAFEFLKNNGDKFTPGKYEIDGDAVFASVQECKLSPEGSGSFEAHRKYIDIQYMVKSSESFQYANLEKLSAKTGYDQVKDIQRLVGEGDKITLTEGYFILFFPEDAHMPCISPDGESGCSHKIVMKVHI